MTREERNCLRAAQAALRAAIRPACTRHGYRCISEYMYRVVGEYLYTVLVFAVEDDAGKALTSCLKCKPVSLDNVYWDVFDMAEVGKTEPFSFHVQGAFTADFLDLESWKTPLPSPEAISQAIDDVLRQADCLIDSYSRTLMTMPDFKSAVLVQPYHTLNVILCEIAEGQYDKALELVEAALANGDDGGFSCGNKSIMQYAKEYCRRKVRLEKRVRST